MSLSEIGSSEAGVEVAKSGQDAALTITINGIIEKLPPNVLGKISTEPASISKKLKDNGILSVGKVLVGTKTRSAYLLSDLEKILEVLADVPPAVPDAIEKAGGLEAYNAILNARQSKKRP